MSRRRKREKKREKGGSFSERTSFSRRSEGKDIKAFSRRDYQFACLWYRKGKETSRQSSIVFSIPQAHSNRGGERKKGRRTYFEAEHLYSLSFFSHADRKRNFHAASRNQCRKGGFREEGEKKEKDGKSPLGCLNQKSNL